MSMTVQPQPDRPDPTVIAAQNDAFRKLACLGVPPAQPIQGRMHVGLIGRFVRRITLGENL
jgi:hypothetical protein